MIRIAPTHLSTADLRYSVRHLYAQPADQPTGETIRKLEEYFANRPEQPAVAAARAAAAEADGEGDTPSADGEPAPKKRRGQRAAETSLAVVHCAICARTYNSRQPGQHYATNHHCRAAREASQYCSLLCRFRSPAPRVFSPPAAAYDPLKCDAPFANNAKEGVVICRGCGGVRHMTPAVPRKKGRPRGRPRSGAAASAAADAAPEAEAAIAAAVAVADLAPEEVRPTPTRAVSVLPDRLAPVGPAPKPVGVDPHAPVGPRPGEADNSSRPKTSAVGASSAKTVPGQAAKKRARARPTDDDDGETDGSEESEARSESLDEVLGEEDNDEDVNDFDF